MKNEILRKVIHTTIALLLALLAPTLGLRGTVAVGAALLLIFLFARKRGRFEMLRRVERVTYGELYFAAGIIVTGLLFLPSHIAVFQAGMLTLGIADTFAALVGKRWGKHQYHLWGETLSYEGSFACLVASAAILHLFGLALIPALLGGLGLAVVEAGASRGSDNLLLPLIAGLLILVL
jgi:phytol kinase